MFILICCVEARNCCLVIFIVRLEPNNLSRRRVKWGGWEIPAVPSEMFISKHPRNAWRQMVKGSYRHASRTILKSINPNDSSAVISSRSLLPHPLRARATNEKLSSSRGRKKSWRKFSHLERLCFDSHPMRNQIAWNLISWHKKAEVENIFVLFFCDRFDVSFRRRMFRWLWMNCKSKRDHHSVRHKKWFSFHLSAWFMMIVSAALLLLERSSGSIRPWGQTEAIALRRRASFQSVICSRQFSRSDIYVQIKPFLRSRFTRLDSAEWRN